MLPLRQFWITAFPALAGVTVAIGGLGAGGSLLQAGAAGLATGMTGYLASTLSVGEAKIQIKCLEQSLEHQKQSDLNTLNLQQLQKEFATLQGILQNLQQDLHKEPIDLSQTLGEPQTEAQTSQLEFEIGSQRQLLATLQLEEQTLKDSIQDLETKREKLIHYLKDSVAKIEQLQSKRDCLKQDIARLIQARQQTANIRSRSQVTTQVAKGSLHVALGSAQMTRTAARVVSGNKYDDILVTIEDQINDLENKAEATAKLASDGLR
jgi:chromosome segregation ATPase